ncbi:MAG: toll/interleukin-1 receptor domain-containing protein, partial [Rubrivivax sp.]|nr:toll/interleukin-1 receptor domain-containing protein [Pyrinomonadaceae bacterium]
MNFEYDIFISYAHIDDLSPSGEEEGWIDLLHKRLSVLLAQALGYELKIWRDGHNLQGNDELDGAIGDAVTRSLLLVPVISPRYVQSDWCNREMEAFHAGETTTSAAAPTFRRRVFKVVKTPLPEHLKKLEPKHISNLIGYEFYGKDDASGILSEFSDGPKDKQYWQMLNRLVANITKTIIELKHSPEPQATDAAAAVAPPDAASSPDASAAKDAANLASLESASPAVSALPTLGGAGGAKTTKFVYLAETTGDLSKERELVADELHQ